MTAPSYTTSGDTTRTTRTADARRGGPRPNPLESMHFPLERNAFRRQPEVTAVARARAETHARRAARA